MAIASQKIRKSEQILVVTSSPRISLKEEPYISVTFPKKTSIRLVQADSLLSEQRNTVLASIFSNIGLGFLTTFFATSKSLFLLISLPLLGVSIGFFMGAVRCWKASQEDATEFLIPFSVLPRFLKHTKI